MKARAGWREKQEVEVTPLRRVEDLSDEELSRMIEACQHMQEQPQDRSALERHEDERAA
ncbi:hypothetical protein GCM10011504_55780 [Siccirubricoccus deserti]|uniref:Uncharacterized protein n=1 Tax=Siccirubricoccus deserti TaxID=2013562 RepID=A0A9X0R538_9PROT|nr:hypothetical protein [Siccirubricoccus deserti]MBC4019080.1 hypothetical protein [Siccirubricoccus deserti]GGC70858.1 hypothetical protein GCM10011504_55780 [Siccirubricoccus deserti]